MAAKTPIRATFTGSDVTGLAEFTASDYIAIAHGGTGAQTAADARTNLDVYSTSEALAVANDLSDVNDAATARTNLDVDSSSEVTAKAVNNGITFSIALG
jgi:hypothetical protein